MIKEILLKGITFVHILFVLFVVIAPFTSSNYILLLHSITLPFMMLHWYFNDNTCILTTVERKLRKQIYDKYDEDDCITCKLIEPIYDFKKNYDTFSKIIYGITIVLWIISTGKLYCKFRNGSIRTIRDLFVL